MSFSLRWNEVATNYLLFPVFLKERKRGGLVISVEREKGGKRGGGGGVAEAK